MKPAAFRCILGKLEAILCVLLVLNLHFWIGGCGGSPEGSLPFSGDYRIDLTPEHPLAQALQDSAMTGAVEFELDSLGQTFRVIFQDETKRLEGHYAVSQGEPTITEITMTRQGRSATVEIDLSKHVTAIKTSDGLEWRRPPEWNDTKSSTARTTATGVQAFMDANAELLNLAREIDRGSGLAAPQDTLPLPGSDEDSSITSAGQGVLGKTDAALAGSILIVLGIVVLLWAPAAATFAVLAHIFLIVFLIQGLIGQIGPPVPMPPTDGPIDTPPPPLVDCNGNGVEDLTDILDGTSTDCDGNGVPDECELKVQPQADCNDNGLADICEADADGDGVIDDCDNCPLAANVDQADEDGNGVGDICDGTLGVSAESSAAWVYENLDSITACALVLSALIGDDPLGNTSYSFSWSVTPPADAPDALFTEVSGANADQATFLGPQQPGVSPGDMPFVVTVEVVGDQFGNTGSASLTVEVRKLGDVNGDGRVCTDDRDILFRVEDGIETDPDLVAASDVNCDGSADARDGQIVISFQTDCPEF